MSALSSVVGGRPIIAERQLLDRSYHCGSLDGDLGRAAQVECALLGTGWWGRAPFNGAIDGAAHLLEPPGGARAEYLTMTPNGALAGGSPVDPEVELVAGIFDL